MAGKMRENSGDAMGTCPPTWSPDSREGCDSVSASCTVVSKHCVLVMAQLGLVRKALALRAGESTPAGAGRKQRGIPRHPNGLFLDPVH